MAAASGSRRVLRADHELRARALTLAAPGLGDAVERHPRSTEIVGRRELDERQYSTSPLRQCEVRVAAGQLLAPDGGRRERRRQAVTAVVDDAGSGAASLDRRLDGAPQAVDDQCRASPLTSRSAATSRPRRCTVAAANQLHGGASALRPAATTRRQRLRATAIDVPVAPSTHGLTGPHGRPPGDHQPAGLRVPSAAERAGSAPGVGGEALGDRELGHPAVAGDAETAPNAQTAAPAAHCRPPRPGCTAEIGTISVRCDVTS